MNNKYGPKKPVNAFIHFCKWYRKEVENGNMVNIDGKKVEYVNVRDMAIEWMKQRGFVLDPNNMYVHKKIYGTLKSGTKYPLGEKSYINWIDSPSRKESELCIRFKKLAEYDKIRYKEELKAFNAKWNRYRGARDE